VYQMFLVFETVYHKVVEVGMMFDFEDELKLFDLHKKVITCVYRLLSGIFFILYNQLYYTLSIENL
jgi:hypothetical protein